MTTFKKPFRMVSLFHFRHYIYIFLFFLSMTTIVKIGQFRTSAVMQMKKQTPTRDTCDTI